MRLRRTLLMPLLPSQYRAMAGEWWQHQYVHHEDGPSDTTISGGFQQQSTMSRGSFAGEGSTQTTARTWMLRHERPVR